jgi:hypothetical protein
LDLSVDNIDKSYSKKKNEDRIRDYHNNSFISDNGDVEEHRPRISISPLRLKYYESHMHDVLFYYLV